MRLNVPSGNAVRFEPGEAKEVELVEFGGNKVIYGFHNEIDGKLSGAENGINNPTQPVCSDLRPDSR
ncbi:hypothetical protein GUF71_21800, partial [Xanthomonas citri pv. citri]|nr:hypothetical protein [Xanthomonas citri pv. citri]